MKTYASFFEWHDKGRKELGVVEELIERPSDMHIIEWTGSMLKIYLERILDGRVIGWWCGSLFSSLSHSLNCVLHTFPFLGVLVVEILHLPLFGDSTAGGELFTNSMRSAVRTMPGALPSEFVT